MTFEKIRDIIADKLQVDAAGITPETNLMKDLEADSLDAVEIVMGIEEEFNITIPDEDAEGFQTVEDLVRFVDSRG